MPPTEEETTAQVTAPDRGESPSSIPESGTAFTFQTDNGGGARQFSPLRFKCSAPDAYFGTATNALPSPVPTVNPPSLAE